MSKSSISGNTTFSTSSTPGEAAGIYNSETGTLTIQDSIIADNSAGGVFVRAARGFLGGASVCPG